MGWLRWIARVVGAFYTLSLPREHDSVGNYATPPRGCAGRACVAVRIFRCCRMCLRAHIGFLLAVRVADVGWGGPLGRYCAL